MEIKTSELLGKFKGIKSQAKQIREEINELEDLRAEDKTILPGSLKQTLQISLNFEERRVKEAKMLLEQYRKSSSEVRDILGTSLTSFSSPSNPAEARGVLRQIETECDRVIGGLESKLSPVSSKEMDKLNNYRSEIDDLTSDLEPRFLKNINSAIDVFEKGHYLASALISSRVIVYLIDKIPGDDDEGKAEFLKDKEIVERKDEKSFVMKANRRARNFFSHDIKTFPDSSDALSLLGDSVTLLKIYIDLQNTQDE